MAEAARALGLSTRSLRRRLSEEGQSFRTLIQLMQREVACRLLRNPDFTLQQIAARLDFADTASFCRTFKRWQGVTAMEFRTAAQREQTPRRRT